MKEIIKQEKKHLIITDELQMCITIMSDVEEKAILIESLIKIINGENVDLDELYAPTRDALSYFIDEKRIKRLILEENIEAKEA